MTTQEITRPLKLCTNCNVVKNLKEGYYKAGSSWQKFCKVCHNSKRMEYPCSNKPYIPKPKGFKKLPEELQKKIIYDKYVRVNFKDIYNKYKDDYPQINHHSLLRWNRAGNIPEYTVMKLP